MNKFERAKRLFMALGQIGDSFLDEAEPEREEVHPEKLTRRRVAAYSAVGAAASIGVIAAVLILRPRALESRNKAVLQETA